MSLALATNFPETPTLDAAVSQHSTERHRHWPLLRFAAVMVAVVVALALTALPLVNAEIEHDRLANAATARISLQRATESLADKTRSLFGNIATLVRLTSLDVKMQSCCGAVAQQQVQSAVLEAMRQSPLGMPAIELRAPDGSVVLALGDEPGAAPGEVPNQLGPGLPWTNRVGRHAMHFVRLLPAYPGYTLRVTVDLDVLASAAEVAAPAGAQTALIRLSDGATLTPLTRDEIDQSVNPRSPITYVGAKLLEQFDLNDRGWLADGPDSQDVQQIAFVTLHELGMVVTAKVPRSRLLAASADRAQILQMVPVAILLSGLALVAGLLISIHRRRAGVDVENGRRLESAEANARVELEQLVRCSPAMLYRGRVSPDGDFERSFLTPNTREVTGWDPDILDDRDQVWNLAPDEDRRVRDNNYIRAVREGRSAAEYRFQRPDGGYSWLRNEAVVIRQLPDGSTEIAGAISNISHEREIAAYAAMQNRLASLGEIAASLAHELTQPMTVIGIAAAIAQGVARNSPLAGELNRQLDAIASQADRASDIIRHLRLYGRADGGPIVDVKLRQATTGALSLAGMALREADVEVVVDIADNLPTVRARQVQVEQVLVNLMINARDAMSANPSTARRLTLRGSVVAGAVRLEIEDTGPGVPTSLIERLFEPFYTTKAPGEGTGLGLSLCQTIMRQFGGSISAANGRFGAIFTLDFPIQASPTTQNARLSVPS